MYFSQPNGNKHRKESINVQCLKRSACQYFLINDTYASSSETREKKELSFSLLLQPYSNVCISPSRSKRSIVSFSK